MKKMFVKIFGIIIFAASLTFVFNESAKAQGVAAGTDITNIANMTYTVGGTAYGLASNPATFAVAELSGFTTIWQDAANVSTLAGATDQVLTFEITNIGNGADSFEITVSNTSGADDFDVTTTAIYLDTNGNGIFELLSDSLYIFGVNDPTLNADQSIKIFVLSDMPLSGLNDGDISISAVTVASTSAVGNYGDILTGAGEGGTDLVIGIQGGGVLEDGTYQAFLSDVLIDKTAVVVDPWGGANVYTGSVITYSLSVTVSGAGTVTSIIVTDPIQAGTTYVPNSLKLNGTGLSDLSDGDEGDVGDTALNTVTVTLPDMDSSSAPQVITFDVTVD